MRATIEEIRKAREVAEGEINLIVKKFAEEYNLQNISVDVSINKRYSENYAEIIAVNVKTEINVQI